MNARTSFIGFIMSFAALVAAADWPCFRGPNHNGIAQMAFEPLPEAKELWRANIGDGRWGGAVVANGKVYANGGDHDRGLWCLDARSGKKLWQLATAPTHSTPTAHAGRVYCIDDERIVHCVDGESGKVIWKTDPLPKSLGPRFWGHVGSPRIWQGLVLLNVGYGTALDAKTGKTVWHAPGKSGLATPVIFPYRGKPAVAIFGGDAVVASDARTGKEHWRIPWKTNEEVNACSPTFLAGNSKVYITSDYGLGRALFDISGEQPKELWNHGSGTVYSSPAYLNDTLYAFTRGSGFGKVDLASGKKTSRAGNNGSAVIVLGDWFLQLTSSGRLRVGKMTAEGYEESHVLTVGQGDTWNVPAYWQGKIYVRNKTGELRCSQISSTN